jgi:hypothetical protein
MLLETFEDIVNILYILFFIIKIYKNIVKENNADTVNKIT